MKTQNDKKVTLTPLMRIQANVRKMLGLDHSDGYMKRLEHAEAELSETELKGLEKELTRGGN